MLTIVINLFWQFLVGKTIQNSLRLILFPTHLIVHQRKLVSQVIRIFSKEIFVIDESEVFNLPQNLEINDEADFLLLPESSHH